MAFNPFHAFRKHQKVMFAGLTIVCMITFVLCGSLSTGVGDLFSVVTDAIGASKSRGDKVATLFGKTITTQDILAQQQRREMANFYMRAAISQAHRGVVENVRLKQKDFKLSDAQKEQIADIVKNWDFAFRHGFFELYHRSMERNIAHLRAIAAELERENKPSDAALIRALQGVIQQDALLMSRGVYMGAEYYFGGGRPEGSTLEQTLEFMLWLRQADDLGIVLTNDDVGKLVRREALMQYSEAAAREVDQALRRNFRNLTREGLNRAIADEFRVRFAKLAVLGAAPGIETIFLTPPTPHEFYEFYKSQRTESTLAVLPIPVDQPDLLAKVGEPSEQELRDLYEKYKDLLPSERSHTGGFRQPRRVEVEWLSARADSPHYREQAERTDKLVLATMQITSGAFVPGQGAVAASAFQAALPLAVDLPLVACFDHYEYKYRTPSWTDRWDTTLHDSSWKRDGNAVMLIGQLAGVAATQAPLLGAPSSFLASAYAQEVKQRSLIWTEMLLAGAQPTPLLALAAAVDATPRERNLPLAAVRRKVREQMLQELARNALRNDLKQVKDELDRLSKLRPDEAWFQRALIRPEILSDLVGMSMGDALVGSRLPSGLLDFARLGHERAVQEFAPTAASFFMAGASPRAAGPVSAALTLHLAEAARAEAVDFLSSLRTSRQGWRFGRTEQPRDEHDIALDSGIRFLRDQYLAHRGDLDPNAKNFSQLFFSGVDNLYTPSLLPEGEHQWLDAEHPVLFWKIANHADFVPPFDSIKDKVRKRWLFEKARDHAKAEADRIADLAKKTKGEAVRVLKDGSPLARDMFYLERVARLLPPSDRLPFSTRAAGDFQPYQVPSDKIAHPHDKFLDLLTEHLKEKGDVFVTHDRPEAHYYVIALVHRSIPTEKDFAKDYSSSPEALLARYQFESNFREDFLKNALEDLKRRAGWHVVDPSDPARKQLESGRGGD
jgi:hypothetical protein